MSARPPLRFLDRTTPPHIVTLVMLAGVSALNMSIFLPSLNQMAVYFDTEYAVMQLAVSGYLAATAVLQLFVGPISDRFGRRRVMLAALVLFVLCTIGALLAQSVTAFLIFRIGQAVVATGMVLSRAIVRDMVPQDEAASMIGYVTMGMALIPMIGPTIGGVLEQAFSWHASFVFLAVAGVAVFVLALFDQGETVKSGGVGFAEQFKGYPGLLSAPRFWGYSLCAAFGSGAFFAFLGGAPYVAEAVYGLSPVMTGLAFGAPAIGYALGNFIAGRLSARIGVNRMAFWGNTVAVMGMGLSLAVTATGFESALLFFGFCSILGLGNGMMLPNATAGLLSVRPQLAGTASGLGGALMIGGGAALSQLAGVVLAGRDTALPLQELMFASVVLALLSILFVMRREARLQAA